MVFRFDKLRPGLSRHSTSIRKVLSEQFVELLVELDVVFLQVFKQALSAKYLAYLHELVLVAFTHKEWLLLKDLSKLNATMEANIAPVDHISSE